MNSDGALLAFSGFHNRDVRITSAIASNVWSAYEKHGHNSFREDPLQFLIINCEGGTVIVTQVCILCLDLFAIKQVNLHLTQIILKSCTNVEILNNFYGSKKKLYGSKIWKIGTNENYYFVFCR